MRKNLIEICPGALHYQGRSDSEIYDRFKPKLKELIERTKGGVSFNLQLIHSVGLLF